MERPPASTVYEELRDQILRGHYGPGTWLREGSLATSLGVSRTPVREALRRLHADGLVELTPHRGAQVVVLNDRDLEATYDLRATLESYGARQAAEVGNADIGGLRQMCAQMEAHLGRADNEAFEEITQLNQAFHQQIHSASGNVALPGLLSGLVQVALVRHTFDHYTPHELERSFAQHRELIDAIEARDGPWAAAVMSTHVLAARASLRRCLNTSTPPDQE